MTKEPPSSLPEDSVEEVVATLEETTKALSSLQKADWAKLQIIARSFFRSRNLGNTWAEPEDLLQESIFRTLNERRRWPKNKVSIIRHLERTMESISGHIAQNRSTNSEKLILLYPPDSPPSPDRILEKKDQIQSLEEILKDDPEAFKVLLLRAEGLSSTEIKTQLCLETNAYDAIRKRIGRAFIRHIKTGEQHDR